MAQRKGKIDNNNNNNDNKCTNSRAKWRIPNKRQLRKYIGKEETKTQVASIRVRMWCLVPLAQSGPVDLRYHT